MAFCEGMHTFVGIRPDDPRNHRDWILTTIWAMSIDGMPVGVVVLVPSGVYIWWNRSGDSGRYAEGTTALA